jgi:hypothetical protein
MQTLLGAVRSRIKTAKSKIPVKSVVITMAEGPTSFVKKLEKRKFRSLESASEAIKPLASSDGYNKVFFTIKFDDNYEYKGRYDATSANYDGKNTLKNHVNRFMNNLLKSDNPFYAKMKPEAARFKKKYAL